MLVCNLVNQERNGSQEYGREANYLGTKHSRDPPIAFRLGGVKKDWLSPALSRRSGFVAEQN
jgi:hypothetical protein